MTQSRRNYVYLNTRTIRNVLRLDRWTPDAPQFRRGRACSRFAPRRTDEI